MRTMASLPSSRLREAAGPVSRSFIEKGITSYRAAAYWILRLPYGANDEYISNSVIFVQGRGTCFSKHGIMAELAGEIGLEIHKYLSFYLCDKSYYPQNAVFLERAGLPGVPRVHCVLMADGALVDLTAGNCHGKARDVKSEDVFMRCEPFVPLPVLLSAYRSIYPYFQSRYPALSSLSAAEAWDISLEVGNSSADACRIAV
jgi:hypothetical protein